MKQNIHPEIHTEGVEEEVSCLNLFSNHPFLKNIHLYTSVCVWGGGRYGKFSATLMKCAVCIGEVHGGILYYSSSNFIFSLK